MPYFQKRKKKKKRIARQNISAMSIMATYFLPDVHFLQGEIASAFGDLLKKLWAPGAAPVVPRTFKLKLAHFAPQFSGFNQHDSQVSLFPLFSNFKSSFLFYKPCSLSFCLFTCFIYLYLLTVH